MNATIMKSLCRLCRSVFLHCLSRTKGQELQVGTTFYKSGNIITVSVGLNGTVRIKSQILENVIGKCCVYVCIYDQKLKRDLDIVSETVVCKQMLQIMFLLTFSKMLNRKININTKPSFIGSNCRKNLSVIYLNFIAYLIQFNFFNVD